MPYRPIARRPWASRWPFVAGHAAQTPVQTPKGCQFSDSHFHLTNYIQEGPSAGEVLKLMGDRVCRTTLFGIPLQQEWSYRESGEVAPTYYLEADAPLYYYSFTDAADRPAVPCAAAGSRSGSIR
jgi:hypothetical protein